MKLVNCNFCGSDNYKALFYNYDRLYKIDKNLFKVVQCGNCGLVYLNPQSEPEELKKYYPEEYGPHLNENQIFKYGPISKIFSRAKRLFGRKKDAPLDSSVKTYLDFGCGSGTNLLNMRLKHPNWRFYGLDINEKACGKTAEKGFEVFCGQSAEKNLPGDFFDIVNMSHVIEHVPDPKQTLLNINQAMKAGGALEISTPNFESLAAKMFGRHWLGFDTPRHLYIFSPETIRKLLEKTGYRVENIEFDDSPKLEIRSLYLLMEKKDIRINPFIWRMAKPFGKILSFCGAASLMEIRATKTL